MKSRYCSNTKRAIIATSTPQQINVTRSVIKRRKSKYYESCWWSVQVPTDTYQSDSKIRIKVEKAVRGTFYIFEGNSRQNATFIANSSNYLIHVESGALIFFMSRKNLLRSGTGAFSV